MQLLSASADLRLAHEVVISYAREDYQLAERLHAVLAAESFLVWRDNLIRGGEDFDIKIRSAIASAKALVVVWSPTSIGSPFVKGEARDGLRRAICVPILIDGLRPEDQPYDFTSTVAISFYEWNGDANSQCFADLVRALDGKGVTAKSTGSEVPSAEVPKESGTIPPAQPVNFTAVADTPLLNALIGLLIGLVTGFLVCSIYTTEIKISGYLFAMATFGSSSAVVAYLSKRQFSVVLIAVLFGLCGAILTYAALVVAEMPIPYDHAVVRLALVVGMPIGLVVGAAVGGARYRRSRQSQSGNAPGTA